VLDVVSIYLQLEQSPTSWVRYQMAQQARTRIGEWEFLLQPGTANAGVVLVHDIYGLDNYIDSVTRRLSDEAYWAAAIDLFRGKRPSTLEEGFKIRSELKENEVLDALQSGLTLLNKKMGADARIGSMGFCMGGGFALLAACNLNFDFCVDYYGMIEDAERVKGVEGPIVLMLGSEDERVTPWAFQYLLPAATKHKKRVDIHLYPNAQHGFHRPNWQGHNPEAARDAWQKTLQFLSQFK
jgi:carboxymethylenebutenolidase